MIPAPMARRAFLRTLAASGGALMAAPLLADEPAPALREPVFRVAKANNVGGGNDHPLDPALAIAQETLDRMRKEVNDYTATMIKRERIKGELGEMEFMFAKVRNRKLEGEQLKTPLSVYLQFLKPESMKGREVLWIEGQNNNKLLAHEGTSIIKLVSVWLDPDGAMAMKGNLHPIYDIGIENLVLKLIEKGNAVRKLGPGNCEVEFKEGARIKKSKNPDEDRVCTVINVRHPQQLPGYEFYLAQIFIDDVLRVPIRYASYHWPIDPMDSTGPVLEEYTYLNLKLNVGLDKADFDPNNANYKFWGR